MLQTTKDGISGRIIFVLMTASTLLRNPDGVTLKGF